MNLALSALPAFRGVDSAADLQGRVHIGPGIDYLERAFDASKYGEISPEPYLDITFPTLHDPSLAPPGAHVMSVYVQFAPYTLAGRPDVADAADELGRIVMRTLAQHAPGIERLVVASAGDHAARSRGDLRAHRRPHPARRAVARSALHDAAGPRLGAVPHADRGLYLCGAGTHPGGGITGGSGQNAAREILKDLKT